MMMAKNMHQIAQIEFRNSKFPHAAPWNPRRWSTTWAPLSSGWIRPVSATECPIEMIVFSSRIFSVRAIIHVREEHPGVQCKIRETRGISHVFGLLQTVA